MWSLEPLSVPPRCLTVTPVWLSHSEWDHLRALKPSSRRGLGSPALTAVTHLLSGGFYLPN